MTRRSKTLLTNVYLEFPFLSHFVISIRTVLELQGLNLPFVVGVSVGLGPKTHEKQNVIKCKELKTGNLK